MSIHIGAQNNFFYPMRPDPGSGSVDVVDRVKRYVGHHVKSWLFYVIRLPVCRGSQKIWNAGFPLLGLRSWLTPRKTPLPHFYSAEFRHGSLYVTSIDREIHQKNRSFKSRLSVSLKLERCCVHNAPPVVTNSCLPPGRCKADVLLAKVCLHCTKPGVAASS